MFLVKKKKTIIIKGPKVYSAKQFMKSCGNDNDDIGYLLWIAH